MDVTVAIINFVRLYEKLSKYEWETGRCMLTVALWLMGQIYYAATEMPDARLESD